MLGSYESEGKLVFLGKHATSGKSRAGVILTDPVGKNDGEVKGHRYFTCADNHGVLVALNKISFTTKIPTKARAKQVKRKSQIHKYCTYA